MLNGNHLTNNNKIFPLPKLPKYKISKSHTLTSMLTLSISHAEYFSLGRDTNWQEELLERPLRQHPYHRQSHRLAQTC